MNDCTAGTVWNLRLICKKKNHEKNNKKTTFCHHVTQYRLNGNLYVLRSSIDENLMKIRKVNTAIRVCSSVERVK